MTFLSKRLGLVQVVGRHLQRSFFSTSSIASMKIVPVPVREDNYAYLLIDDKSNKAAAVDPYTISKVKAAADQLGVQIVAAITTHHHFDHSGGNEVSVSPHVHRILYRRYFD
jgi:glyoxylase-like metal-dependent hydrolase (beta-lactamase superfamily II)